VGSNKGGVASGGGGRIFIYSGEEGGLHKISWPTDDEIYRTREGGGEKNTLSFLTRNEHKGNAGQ